MARYLVRYAVPMDDPSYDNTYGLFSAPGPFTLFDIVDEEDNPYIMEFLELPQKKETRWNRIGDNAPWQSFDPYGTFPR